MGMTLPVPTVTPGPLYATENNQAFTVIDGHDHSPGNGVPIPSVGININGDLSFNGYNLSTLRSTLYSNQSAPLALPTDLRSIYSVGGDLYWNNGIGQPVQITAGAALNAASIGGIGGDYTTSGASVFYTSAVLTYFFWSAANTTGSIDAGPITIRNNTINSFGVTINAYPTISANYNLVLPASLPGSGVKFLTVDSSGNIADVYDTDNTTITVTSNLLNVTTAGFVDNVTIQSTGNLIGVKPGSITYASLGPLNIQFSSSTGNLGQTASATYVDVNVPSGSFSVTITTTGRPVMIAVQADGTDAGYTEIAGAAPNTVGGIFRFVRDSTTLAEYRSDFSGNNQYNPSWTFIDVPAAGTYVYKGQIASLSGGSSWGIKYCRIIAYEL